MAQKLREANPDAFRNIVGRMLEHHGRGFWQPDADKLQHLRELYELTDDKIEGVTVLMSLFDRPLLSKKPGCLTLIL